jgi:hypothetical protein
MKTVTRLTAIPENSMITSGFGKIDYCDVYRISKITNNTAEEITTRLFKLPRWANWLMSIRDAIVRIFRLKTSKEILHDFPTQNFPVISQHENEIVSGINDKHLDYRLSVLIDRDKSSISFTTIVRYNNLLGRLYFLPVRIFHKMIVKTILKREAEYEIEKLKTTIRHPEK